MLFPSAPDWRDGETLEQRVGGGGLVASPPRIRTPTCNSPAHCTDNINPTEAPEEPTTSWHTVFAHGDAVERLQNVQIGCADVPPLFHRETPC